jgi:hypothetical protein
VSRSNQSFVLKDSWVLENLVESKIAHLQAMMGHDEINLLVPTFIAGGDVKINGITDSTANYRGLDLLGQCYKFSYLIVLCHRLAICSLYYILMTRLLTRLLIYHSRQASLVYTYIIFSASLLIHMHSQTD